MSTRGDTGQVLADHLRELQWRLFAVAAVFIAGSVAAYAFHDQVITLLLSPLHGEKLVYLNPTGGFSFILLVSMYMGLAVAIPILLQQIYAFVKPALPTVVKHYSLKIFISSLLLLIAGVLFGFYVAIPGALNFLTGFADQYVSASLTADSYLNFVIAYTLGLGLVFQIPLVLVFIHWIRPLTPGGLLKSERWIVLIAFIAAAIITPTPDPMNQTIVALPVIVVYQLGVVAVLLLIRKAKKEGKMTPAAVKTQPSPAAAKTAPSPAPTPAPALRPAAPARQTLSAPAALAARPAVRSMDGMRSSPSLARNIQPPRPAPVSSRLPSRGFSVDGVSVPQRAGAKPRLWQL